MDNDPKMSPNRDNKKARVFGNDGWFNQWSVANSMSKESFIEWFNSSDLYFSVMFALYIPNHFHIWWDADKFDWSSCKLLCEHQTNHFETWYDPTKFKWEQSQYLWDHCMAYLDQWEEDFIIYDLGGDLPGSFNE